VCTTVSSTHKPTYLSIVVCIRCRDVDVTEKTD
jgi:hypothetical protein